MFLVFINRRVPHGTRGLKLGQYWFGLWWLWVASLTGRVD